MQKKKKKKPFSSHLMGKSGNGSSFRRAPGHCLPLLPRLARLHVVSILKIHVVVRGFLAASTLHPPSFGFGAQEPVVCPNGTDSFPYISVGWARPWSLHSTRVFQGNDALMGQPRPRGPWASGRKRARWSSQGKCGCSDQKKESRETTPTHCR